MFTKKPYPRSEAKDIDEKREGFQLCLYMTAQCPKFFSQNCSKCGNTFKDQFTSEYKALELVPNARSMSEHVYEHIKRTCSHCGFSWAEKPMDFKHRLDLDSGKLVIC